jgi:hypothetical protein
MRTDNVPCRLQHVLSKRRARRGGVGEVPSDARDRVRADEVVVLTEECTNTTRHCIYMCDYPSNT